MLSSISPSSLDAWTPQSETHPVSARPLHTMRPHHTAHSSADRHKRTSERIYAACVLATGLLLLFTAV
jgi:hypothetical protein